jgi:hypothetical protein
MKGEKLSKHPICIVAVRRPKMNEKTTGKSTYPLKKQKGVRKTRWLNLIT